MAWAPRAAFPETSGHSPQGGEQAAGPQANRAQDLQGKLQTGPCCCSAQASGSNHQQCFLWLLALGTIVRTCSLLAQRLQVGGLVFARVVGGGFQDGPEALLKLRATRTGCPGATKIRGSLNQASLFSVPLQLWRTSQSWGCFDGGGWSPAGGSALPIQSASNPHLCDLWRARTFSSAPGSV